MENKTLQLKIYEASKIPTRRDFAKAIRRTGPYVSNMLNSDIDVSVDLAIDMCDRLQLDREEAFNMIVDHLRGKIFYY